MSFRPFIFNLKATGAIHQKLMLFLGLGFIMLKMMFMKIQLNSLRAAQIQPKESKITIDGSFLLQMNESILASTKDLGKKEYYDYSKQLYLYAASLGSTSIFWDMKDLI